jgi:hypothetical protein
MQKNLIPDLENIIGDYTDKKDYPKLINANPSVHNLPKLKSKIVENIPVDDLSIIAAAYRVANKWDDEVGIMGQDSILDLIPIFMQLVRLFGEDYDFMNDKKRYTVVIDGKENFTKIKRIIDDKIYIGVDNISSGSLINTNMLSKKQQKKILDFLDLQEWDDDSEFDFYSKVEDAVKILMNNDPDFHPMTNFNQYKEALINIILEEYTPDDEEENVED